MKKIYSFIAMAAMLTMGSLQALAGTNTYYSKAVVESTGNGLIYVSKTTLNAEQQAAAEYVESMEATQSATSQAQNYYVYTKPEEGYFPVFQTIYQFTERLNRFTFNALSTDEANPTIGTLTVSFEKYLLEAGKYTICAEITPEEGVTVPESLEKYMGGQKTFGKLVAADEANPHDLTVESEGSLINGLTVKKNSVVLTSSTTLTIEGREFGVKTMDNATNGELKISQVEGTNDFTFEPFKIVYKGNVVGTVTNVLLQLDTTGETGIAADKKNNSSVRKYMKNGAIVIEKDGVQYNVAGAKLK